MTCQVPLAVAVPMPMAVPVPQPCQLMGLLRLAMTTSDNDALLM